MLFNTKLYDTTYLIRGYLCSSYPENNLFTLNGLIPKDEAIGSL